MWIKYDMIKELNKLLEDKIISKKDIVDAYIAIKNEEYLDLRLKVLENSNKITIRWDVPNKYVKLMSKSYDGITIPLSFSMKELIFNELKRELE